MGWVSISSGVCCLLALALNMRFRPHTDAVSLSLALLVSWSVYQLINGLQPWERSIWLFAGVDLVVGLAAWKANQTQPEAWKRLLYRLILLQLVLHAVFWFDYAWGDQSLIGSMRYAYASGLLVLGFAQIACGAWPGAMDATASLRAVLSGDHGRGPRVGAAG
jgi:hypothetical protein